MPIKGEAMMIVAYGIISRFSESNVFGFDHGKPLPLPYSPPSGERLLWVVLTFGDRE
jgi:hypothetical protein